MAKSVKVHDDTHRALKMLKARRRKRSMDEVIREAIRDSTGSPVEDTRPSSKTDELTNYIKS
ncbi:MAG TPA: ribbon-helix-helix protein, CopG family [Nitrososphaerales archaeon]|nr:ribbon-helix-helix protein, CopG family [Nitrososphaerales archaeon]